MKAQKVLYVVSDINKSLEFEWLSDNLSSDIDLNFVLIGPSDGALQKFLELKKRKCIVIPDKMYRSHLSKAWKILTILLKDRPSIVHTHLWRANLLTLPLAWLLRIPRRIYTRHHATIHYTLYPSGRKWDRLINFLATDIVAISENVKTILINMDGADPRKISIIRHGFDLEYFRAVEEPKVRELIHKYLPPSAFPVIGVISRYLELKGIQYIIPAFKELRKKYPSAFLVLANAKGDYSAAIKQLLGQIPSTCYVEIEFENELNALYKLFTVFVHVPTGPSVEAYGQTYVEALAAGIPSVFTLSGIASEFVEDEVNALVVDFKDQDEIYRAVLRLIEDQDLRERIVAQGLVSVEQFSLVKMIGDLNSLYHGASNT